MKVYAKKTYNAFTLIELLIVIAIIGILASAAMPAYNGILERGKRIKDVSNVKNILLGCRTFAMDWEGLYPSFDPDDDAAGGGDGGFSTSTEAFNVLIPDYIDNEAVFWVQSKHPDKLRGPNMDGELLPEENTYFYVVNQTDTSYSNSPLAGDGLMDGPGEFGEFHPWLKSKKAVIGYCGGHVNEERLTGAQAGATARSKKGNVQNIFDEYEVDEDGKSSGGWLDTSKDNVLLPD